MLNINQLLISVIMVVATVTVFSGCASDASRQMRHGGIESKTLYQQANSRDSGNRGRYDDVRRAKHMISSKARYEPYTRTALNETDVLFKLLPNPKIMIHVYPHLSTRDNAPVPGYTTGVSLYSSDEYALPTELIAQGIDPQTTESTQKPTGGHYVGDEELLTDGAPNGGTSTEVKMIRDMNRQAVNGDAS